MRRHSDRDTGHEDHVEDSRKDLYADEYLPRDAEAGSVDGLCSSLIFPEWEDHCAEQEQHVYRDPDGAIHDSRLGIRLHVGPVRAVADVGAVARVEACAPNRVQG